MDRIGPAGGSPTGTLSNGQQGFIDQNLSTGQQGTEFVAAYENAVQEELMTLLATAAITPNIANFGQVLASIQTIIAQQANAFLDTNGNFYFQVQIVGSTPLIVQGGPCTVPLGSPSISQLLPVSFNTYMKGGLASDGGGAGYGYGVLPGVDLQHAAIYCPLTQIVGSSLGTRPTVATGFFIVWGK